VIVCEDADVADAAKKLAFVKYRNAGQACLCPSRFWIAEGVYESFVAQFMTHVAQLKVGDGFDAGVTMGPVANHRRLAAVQSLVDDAVNVGANLLVGGRRIGETGCFFEPTVLAQVPAQARILSEEPFGPIAILNSYSDLDKVIADANSLPYGLAAYIFTRNASTANRLASQLECGAIGINHLVVSTSGVPFGGFKDSGYGREGGIEGVQSYTVTKTVSQMFV
jgi:succinate-semialdehyde dehydrogenase/glutarate-semialdehyde dehydrogenase